VIVVTNYRDHYALLLPYSTEWKFSVERGRRLRGTGGGFNVTLTIEASDLSPDAQMKYVRTNVTSDRNPLPPDKTELMSVNGEPVLRTEINAERVDKAFKERSTSTTTRPRTGRERSTRCTSRKSFRRKTRRSSARIGCATT
jgi:hypothetical protein